MTKKWIGSPNFDTNRKPIDTIVIHWFGDGLTTSNAISSVDAQFQKAGGTSAHYAVEKDLVHQYVKEEHVAYHAGSYTMNQRSIGIEHSAGTNRQAAESTYRTSASLIREICEKYRIPIDKTHIVPHRSIKSTQCPGTIDIDKLIALAKEDESKTALQECLMAHNKAVTAADKLQKEKNEMEKSHEEEVKKIKEVYEKRIKTLEDSLETMKVKHASEIADIENKCKNKILRLETEHMQDLEDKKKEWESKCKEDHQIIERTVIVAPSNKILLQVYGFIMSLDEVLEKNK